MKSLFDFIVEPVGQRYNNEVKIGDKSLIINTKSENFKSVNNIGIVVELPKAYKTVIKKGDLIMIHHNVFRRFYNIRGNEKTAKHILKITYILCKQIKYIYTKELANGKLLEIDVLFHQ